MDYGWVLKRLALIALIVVAAIIALSSYHRYQQQRTINDIVSTMDATTTRHSAALIEFTDGNDAPQPTKPAPAPTGPGSLKGVVLFGGEPPEIKDFVVPKDHNGPCKCETVKNETLVVDKATKGIKWAMVRILDVKDAPELKDPPNVTLDQPGCRYEPHVFIMAPGSELTVLNPDKIGHNVKTTPYDGLNRGTNLMMVDGKMVMKSKFFTEPEIIKIECSIHGWMNCFAVVHDPRFAAITGDDGKFEIKDLPAGKYKVSIFHETLGEKNIDVEIKPGSATDSGKIEFIKK